MSNTSAEKFDGEARVVQTGSNDLSVEQRKPTFVQKTKRHCARFWWLHLIIFCLSFLIISLCLVYVALPKIAQAGVNAASFTIMSMKFLNPKANSFTFSQSGTLHNPKIFTPTLDAFNVSAYLILDGEQGTTSMIEFPMPSIHAVDGSTVTVDSVPITIEHMDAVFNFTSAVLTRSVIHTRLIGSTRLHLGALPVNAVQFDQIVTYAGLNGLEGFNVTDIRVNLSAPAGEPNLRGTAIVPNASPLTINMGNVTLNMATVAAGMLGNATINDMTLVPGTNLLNMTGFIDQGGVLNSMNSTGYANLLIWGQSAIANGENLVYYEHALAGQNLSLPLNVGQVLHDSGY